MSGIALQILPPTDPGIISGPDSLCIGSSVIFSESKHGYWSGVGNGVFIDSFGKVTAQIAGIDTIIFFANSACGWADNRKAIRVLDYVDPGPLNITGPDSICWGDSALFQIPVSAVVGNWTASGGYINSSDGEFIGRVAGRDTVKYNISNYCFDRIVSHPLEVVVPLEQPRLAGKNILCFSRPDTLAANPSGGLWYATNKVVTVNDGILRSLEYGTDTIIYSVSNQCGQKSDSVVAFVPAGEDCDSIYADTLKYKTGTPFLFPNPNHGEFFIDMPGDEPFDISVVNLKGEVIYDAHFARSSHVAERIYLHNVAADIYVVKAVGTQYVFKGKILVD